MLYAKSIISSTEIAEAINQVQTRRVRTESLLSVVEGKIRAEPHLFTEFVKIMESQPTLRLLAKGLVKNYGNDGAYRNCTIFDDTIIVWGMVGKITL